MTGIANRMYHTARRRRDTAKRELRGYMATFGDIERAFADLYPYRWAIGAAVLVFIAAALAFAYWRGWHLVAWRYRKPLGIISVPLLALTIWLGWSLGAPLFTNVSVDEAFPYAATATVPDGMEREDIEQIFSGMAMVDSPVIETMPAPAAIDAGAALASDEADAEDALAVITPIRRAALEQAMAMAMDASEADTMDEAATMTGEAVAMIEEVIAESEMTAQPATPPGQQSSEVQAVAQGNFKDADAFHRGSGNATIYRTPDGAHLLRLENLEVTNGPALRVILSTHPDPERSEQVKQEGYIDLGDLKGNRGNQNYPIPTGADISNHKSVVIYCYPFAVVFSVATLEN